MRFFNPTTLAFLLLTTAAAAAAAQVQAHASLKEVVVTYPPSTPQSIIDEAISRIAAEGGEVLHVFTLLKGFIAKASAQVLQGLETLSLDIYKPNIEEDKPVSINS